MIEGKWFGFFNKEVSRKKKGKKNLNIKRDLREILTNYNVWILVVFWYEETNRKKYETIGEILIPKFDNIKKLIWFFCYDSSDVIKLRCEKAPLELNAEPFTYEIVCLGSFPKEFSG